MLANVVRGDKSEHRKLLLAGIAYLTCIALLISLSIAVYRKTFADVTTVHIKAERAGLQLAKFGDVRINGALVGSVRSITNDGKQAVIKIALDPEAARHIPENISVRIVPTTLFGQKYVDLMRPPDPSESPLRDGAVIPASRVNTNVELQTVLSDLFPLLRSVRPADLNATLYAISHALQGKGEQIGETVESLDSYLRTMNVHLPQLKRDLQLFAEVAKTYSLAAPDLIRLLRNATTTARTVTQRKGDLERTLVSMTGLSRSARKLLSENEAKLIEQGRAGRPLLALLDTYSPELPCLIEGLYLQIPNAKNIFADSIIHQTLELGAPQRKAYTAADAPVYGEVGHGPWCLGLPANYQVPAPFIDLKDGSDADRPGGGLE